MVTAGDCDFAADNCQNFSSNLATDRVKARLLATQIKPILTERVYRVEIKTTFKQVANASDSQTTSQSAECLHRFQVLQALLGRA